MTGRPPMFADNKKLETDIQDYFDACDKESRPYTVSGLAYSIGTNRQTLLNYQNKDEFFDTIQSAKARIEAWTEEQLFRPSQVRGVVFNLKNNYGWRDNEKDMDQQNQGGIVVLSPLEAQNLPEKVRSSLRYIIMDESLMKKYQ